MITAKCIKNEGDWCNYPELELDKEYQVDRISVGQSCSYAILSGMTRCFNTVCFEFYEDGKPLNFLRDKRFNLYLGVINHG